VNLGNNQKIGYDNGYEIKMKYHTLTLLDTKGAVIEKVARIKNRIFLLNIETDVPKCMCEG
jgi:hypothetical protein